jgi:hypothetical protein
MIYKFNFVKNVSFYLDNFFCFFNYLLNFKFSYMTNYNIKTKNIRNILKYLLTTDHCIKFPLQRFYIKKNFKKIQRIYDFDFYIENIRRGILNEC